MKIYLDNQTEGLVHSIHALVGSVRADESVSIIRDHTGDIATLVGKVITSTETAISNTGNETLRDRAEPVLHTLSDCKTRLLNTNTDGESIREPARLKEHNNRLPPMAFEIARETKELVHRVEQISNEAIDEDDFR